MIYGTFGPQSWTKQCQSSAFRRHVSGIFHVFVSPAIVVCRIGPSLPIIVFDLGPMIWYSATIVMLILFMYSHICRIVVVRFLSSNGVWAGISNSRFWCQCFCRFCALFFLFFFWHPDAYLFNWHECHVFWEETCHFSRILHRRVKLPLWIWCTSRKS